MDEMAMEDKLATVESLILGEIAAHGGQRIIAGPEMQQLATEIRQSLQEQGWLNLEPRTIAGRKLRGVNEQEES